jgi:hypothetical protein
MGRISLYNFGTDAVGLTEARSGEPHAPSFNLERLQYQSAGLLCERVRRSVHFWTVRDDQMVTAGLFILMQAWMAQSSLDRVIDYQCPGLEGYEIQVVHHIDSGVGTIRSKADGRTIAMGIGPMQEHLVPRGRPAGYRSFKIESVGEATVAYGLYEKTNVLQVTILNAPLSAVVNLAVAPNDEMRLLTVARTLATSQCTWKAQEP